MNERAFNLGWLAELEKCALNLSLSGAASVNTTAKPDVAKPAHPSMPDPLPPASLKQQMSVARQEGENAPSTADVYRHDFLHPSSFLSGLGNRIDRATSRDLAKGSTIGGSTPDDGRFSQMGRDVGHWMERPFAKSLITSSVNSLKPGETIKPLSASQQMDRDEVMNGDPKLLPFAQQEAARRSQEIASGMSVDQLKKIRPGSVGSNNPLDNNLKNFVANDPDNLEALSGIVGDKTHGAFGVGPGLKPKLTPGNFLSQNWGWLAGGAAVALLAYFMGGGSQQPTVVNNYGGGQQGQPGRSGPMPSYQPYS